MRAINDIDDPRLVKALAHPLRIQILRVLEDRVASPSDIAEELGAPLGNVSYHVRILVKLGLLKLVKKRPRRGAIEHYYEARGKVQVSNRAWGQVPDIVKEAMVGATLDQVGRYVDEAARMGGFDRPDAHLTRQPLRVDKQGWQELAGALREMLERADQIEAESIERLEKADHDGELEAGLVLMLFEGPSAGAPTALDGDAAAGDAADGDSAAVSSTHRSGSSRPRQRA